MRNFFNLWKLFVLAVLLLVSSSCQLLNRSSRQRQKVEKRMEDSRTREQERYAMLKQQHFDRQSEQTKKMMKKQRKRNKQLLKRHRNFTFWQKIFGKRHRRLGCR